MSMVWVASASLLHPDASGARTVTKRQIDEQVESLFGASITPVMINKHLVNSEDRQADKSNPARGGSRNRYLVRDCSGFRLYKKADAETDAWEKTGPTHPKREAVGGQFAHLVDWYERTYY